MATISENLQTLIDIKADIKTAIENKGVTVGDAGFGEYAGKIDSIEGGSAWTLPSNTKFADGPTEYPVLFFDNLTSCYIMFHSCSVLTSVPLFDTSNVTSISEMFYDCYSLTSLPMFDLSSCEDISYAFYGCLSLTSLPQFNTSNVKLIRGFMGNSSIISLPELDFSSVTAASGDVYYLFNSCRNLVNIGGLRDLGKSFHIGNRPVLLNFTDCLNLTYESCMNVINKVYDLTITAYTSDAKIKLPEAVYLLLSADDIAIATAKGWAVESA